jgi:diguanylate cyclase (GGDEF)-like protein
LDELQSDSGHEGLIRNFCRILTIRFGVHEFMCAAVVKRGGTVRAVPVEGLAIGALGNWSEVQLAIEASVQRPGYFEFGVVHPIETNGNHWIFCRIGDIDGQQFALVFNSPSQEYAPSVGLLVKQLQIQMRWHQRFAETTDRVNRDDLTKLYNCGYFEEAIDRELRRSDRFHSEFSVLFLDIDDFKAVNDRYGHLAGSGVLKQLAKVMLDVLREVDVVARYGGDEFVALLLGANTHFGRHVAERLRERIMRSDFDVGRGQKTSITVSVGMATYPRNGKSREELMLAADRSMYQSKKCGKNRVTIDSDDLENT